MENVKRLYPICQISFYCQSQRRRKQNKKNLESSLQSFHINFLKFSFHFLVEDFKSFHMICKNVSTVNNKGKVDIFSVTDGWTYTF